MFVSLGEEGTASEPFTMEDLSINSVERSEYVAKELAN
jgi:hypothetical protein